MLNSTLPVHPLSTEDKHLLYLVGNYSQGESPIGQMDHRKVRSAQNHPITNTIGSLFAGTLLGLNYTVLGALASPFLNSDTRETIIGDSTSVCSNVGKNTEILLGTKNSIDRFISGDQGFSSKITRFFKESFLNPIGGILTGSACVAKQPETDTIKYRVINHAGSVVSSVKENALPIAGIAFFLIAALTLRIKHNEESAEAEAEQELLETLEQRYGEIAEHLKMKNADREKGSEKSENARELARGIIDNQVVIVNDLLALNLPHLSVQKAQEIAQPLFTAAREILAQ